MKKYWYLAGLMDADGCFNVSRCRETYTPRLLVTNTNLDIIEWLVENFGGHFYKNSVKDRPKWKPRYIWRLSNQKALDLSDKIADHLIIKEVQGLIFRTWSATRENYPTKKRKEGYEYLSAVLKAFNRRGVKCPANKT